MPVAPQRPALRRSRPHAIDRIGGSLVNVILGALILWVGQTCFRHAGMLASFDQKFSGIGQQFTTVDAHHDSLQDRIDRLVTDISDRTRSRFTREDGEKLAGSLKEISRSLVNFERQFVERINNLQMKVVALETNHDEQQKIAQLNAEVNQLRATLPSSESQPRYAHAADPRSARHSPVYLPPVTQRP